MPTTCHVDLHFSDLLPGYLSLTMCPSATINVTLVFTLKHLLISEICAREIREKFVYMHSEAIEYVKN